MKSNPKIRPTDNVYVALLRGINVGGNRIIKSADLQKCFEGMGFESVRVFLQSGNVVFSTSKGSENDIREAVEKALEKNFKYPARIVLRSKSSLKKTVKSYPFDRSKADYQHYIIFLSPDLEPAAVDVSKADKSIEKVEAGKDVIYWTVKKGSTLSATFGKYVTSAKFKHSTTVRNINTLEKLLPDHKE